MNKIAIFFISSAYLFAVNTFAFALPAFPGAEGFGSDTRGAYGLYEKTGFSSDLPEILHVTNLNDSGMGSLRDALTNYNGPRIIVFDTGGVINLETDINIRSPYVTIAGQTAPGDGICLKGRTLRLVTNDIILRGIRGRSAKNTNATDNYDGLKIEGYDVAHDIIIDHCSFSWSSDEVLCTWGRTSNITIQRNIFSEPLAIGKSKGVLFGPGTERLTFHHNYMAHNKDRNPLAGGGGGDGDPGVTYFEVINNFIYNYYWYGGRMMSNPVAKPTDPGQRAHWVQNHFKAGPETTFPNGIDIRTDDNVDGTRVYVKGNIGPGRLTNTGDEWGIVYAKYKDTFKSSTTVFTPSGVTLTAVEDVMDDVLDDVGATIPARDETDARVIKDGRDGTGHYLNSVNDVGGYPTYATGTAPADTDRDGMPDDWEKVKGLDPNDLTDSHGDRNGDGYSNLEEYLNNFFTPTVAQLQVPRDFKKIASPVK